MKKRYNARGYSRINKAQARRRYNQGLPVYMCLCNERPAQTSHRIPDLLPSDYNTFDAYCRWYQLKWGCCGAGYYPAYYVKDEDSNPA